MMRDGDPSEAGPRNDPAVGDTVMDPRTAPSGRQLARSSVQFVEPPPPPARGAPIAPPVRGDQIGRFVVLDVLGTGGMGVVYSAYDPQLDRKVAIKLLGAEIADSSDAQMRLLREAQAMARINHPNVLKVHEAGTYNGQIYVAMEFADGGTLRGWLMAGTRSTREVVDAFLQAGRGLAAAHAAGLVHRDFKPDNVLMFKDGGIRVTDFGLVGVVGERAPAAAAAPDAPLSNDTPLSQNLTRTGSVMGTPSYMAPEQFLGQVATPAADQFAFCVALYEALYRQRPFGGSTYQELATAVVAGTLLPVPREIDVPAALRKLALRGMSVDPAKRFGSMAELLAELARDPAQLRRRVLVGVGVAAVAAGVVAAFALRPAPSSACSGGDERLAEAWSPTQRAKLAQAFAASHRPDASDVLAHVVPVVDGWGAKWKQAYVGACQDTHLRKIQSEHLLDVRMECLTRKLDDARATLQLLASGGGDAVDHAMDAVLALPSVAPCADTAALTAAMPPPETPAAKQAVAAVRKQLADARAQNILGRYTQGLSVAQAALGAARKAAYPPAVAEAMLTVGVLQNALADHAAADTLRDAMDLAAAAGDAELLIGAAARRVSLLSSDTDQVARADDLAHRAVSLAAHAPPSREVSVRLDDAIGQLDELHGHPKDARVHFEQALALAQAKLAPAHPATISALGHLGSLATEQGKFDEARRLIQQVVDAEERVAGKNSPGVAYALVNLGDLDEQQGNFADAKQHFDRAYGILSAALGPDHPDVATALGNLGAAYAQDGDMKTAKAYFENGLAVLTKVYGEQSTKLVDPLNNLAAVDDAAGDFAGARSQLERAIGLIEKAYGPDDPRLSRELKNAAVIADQQQRYDDALGFERRAEQIAEKTYGPDHPLVADALAQQATTYEEMNKLPEAREITSRALQVVAKAYGPDHPAMADALYNYGSLQEKLGDHAGALASFQRAETIYEHKFGKDHVKVASALVGAGGQLTALHRAGEAVPLLERAVAIRTAAKQPPGEVASARFSLAKALAAAPATRARGRAEAQTALAEYQQAKAADDAREIQRWLSAH